MFKPASVFLLGAFAAAGVFAATSGASAGHRYGNCCGPIPPTKSYSTVEKVSHVTRYHDEWRKHYVDREKLYIHVTRVQPVVYVHNVTRIHTETVPVIRPVHVSRVQYLPTETVVQNSVVHIDEGCVCCSHH